MTKGNLLTSPSTKNEKGSALNRNKILFKICIQECLHQKFCFKKLKSADLKLFETFINETVGKKLTITQVEDMFLRTKGKPINEEKINGIKRQIIHFGKDRTPFRIFGYYNEEGYFVSYKIDAKHKTHKG